MIHPHFDSTNPQKICTHRYFLILVLVAYRCIGICQNLCPKSDMFIMQIPKICLMATNQAMRSCFLTLQAVDWLCRQGCKLIVIACNSASAYSLTTLRIRCRIPIVGLVPAVKPACEMSQTRQIAFTCDASDTSRATACPSHS